MNAKNLRLFTAVIVISGLAGFGCAKKQKPDNLSGAEAANSAAIQDKELSFEAQGSDSGKIEGLTTVHFEFDKSSLNDQARDLLSKNANWLKSHPNKSLQIEGHCDRSGSEEYNLALGERRANAVKEYLLNIGVSKDRLSTVSYGKEKLLDTAETETADAANRRANFKPMESPSVKRLSQN